LFAAVAIGHPLNYSALRQEIYQWWSTRWRVTQV